MKKMRNKKKVASTSQNRWPGDPTEKKSTRSSVVVINSEKSPSVSFFSRVIYFHNSLGLLMRCHWERARGKIIENIKSHRSEQRKKTATQCKLERRILRTISRDMKASNSQFYKIFGFAMAKERRRSFSISFFISHFLPLLWPAGRVNEFVEIY